MNAFTVFSAVIFSTFSCCYSISCNAKDKHAPCACMTILSATTIPQGGNMIAVEFQEAICDVRENRRRMKKGAFGGKFFCHQVKDEKMAHHDVNGPAVHVKVNRRNGKR